MEKMQILFGFESLDFENAIIRLLKSKGIEAEISSKMTKLNIREFLEKNHNCNTVVLKEAFSKDVYYTAEEIAQLTDMRDVNVIIVLSDKRRGTDYMCTLYAAGITNAIFQKGRNGGASPKDIATLILQRRTRKDAREYYGIASNKIELGFLDNTTYVEFYRDLKQEDGTLLENYINVCARMSPQQIADFTRRLPKDDISELAQFEEFHVVMQLLKRFGIDLKIKKPKVVRVGLNTPVGITIEDDKIHVTPAENKENESVVKEVKTHQVPENGNTDADSKSPQDNIDEFIVRKPIEEPIPIKEEPVKQEPVPEEHVPEEAIAGNPYKGLSLADLFSGGVGLSGIDTTINSVSDSDKGIDKHDSVEKEQKGSSIFDKVMEEVASSKDTGESVVDRMPVGEDNKVFVDDSLASTGVEEVIKEELIKEELIKEQEDKPVKAVVEEKGKKEEKKKEKLKKESKKEKKSAKKEEIESTYFEEEDEHTTRSEIVFDDYDASYDDISLDSGADSKISVPFLISILFLVIALICLVVYGNGRFITLF